MRIGINALSILPGKIGGGETYLENLIRKLGEINKEHEIFLFVSPFNLKLFEGIKGVKLIECPYYKTSNTFFRIFYEQLFLPHLLKNYAIEILHSPANCIPFLSRCKNVLTIQHLITFYLPKLFPLWKRLILNYLIYNSCKRSDMIISISNSVKDYICSQFGIKPEKIVTVYHGVDFSIFKPIDRKVVKAEIQKEYGISDDFIFTISTLDPQKNPLGIIHSFKKLLETYEKPIMLVQAGLKSSKISEMQKEIIKLGLQEKVVLLDFVPNNKMPYFYNAAELLFFPSLGEAFGLPLLEAMACGCPVVTSNVKAPPEIVGEAGLTCDPYSPQDMSDKIEMVLNDPSLRKRLIDAGFKRVKAFNWEKAAKETLDAYSIV